MFAISARTAARRTAIALAAATAATTLSGLPSTAAPAPFDKEFVAPSVGLLEVSTRQAVTGATKVIAQQRKARAEREAKRRAAEAARKAAEAARSRADKVMDLAAREAGDPYVWGAMGPNAFDCSGYTMYVFNQVGISLPHSSAAQAAMARPVSDPQVGDLVFFGGSRVYHVAIYAGDGYIWHAPRTGDVVKKERIWTGDVFFGRVG